MPRIDVGTSTVAIYTPPTGTGVVAINAAPDAAAYFDTVSTITADSTSTGGRLVAAGQAYEGTLAFGTTLYARTASGTTSVQYVIERIG